MITRMRKFNLCFADLINKIIIQFAVIESKPYSVYNKLHLQIIFLQFDIQKRAF